MKCTGHHDIFSVPSSGCSLIFITEGVESAETGAVLRVPSPSDMNTATPTRVLLTHATQTFVYPCCQETAGLNPHNATVICGQESMRAKLAVLSGSKGWLYFIWPCKSERHETMVCGLTYALEGECVTLPSDR